MPACSLAAGDTTSRFGPTLLVPFLENDSTANYIWFFREFVHELIFGWFLHGNRSFCQRVSCASMFHGRTTTWCRHHIRNERGMYVLPSFVLPVLNIPVKEMTFRGPVSGYVTSVAAARRDVKV